MNVRWLMPLLATCLSLPLQAQPAPAAEAPVTKASKILEVLAPKEIVVDTSGQASRPPTEAAINLTVQFAFNSAELLPQGRQQLDELAVALADSRLREAGFEVGGHTDRVGDAAYNLRLSRERASAVRDYLIRRHGVAASRLSAVGHGFERLLLPDQPHAAANRRVEIRRLTGGLTPTPGASLPASAPALSSTPPAAPVPAPRLVPTPR